MVSSMRVILCQHDLHFSHSLCVCLSETRHTKSRVVASCRMSPIFSFQQLSSLYPNFRVITTNQRSQFVLLQCRAYILRQRYSGLTGLCLSQRTHLKNCTLQGFPLPQKYTIFHERSSILRAHYARWVQAKSKKIYLMASNLPINFRTDIIFTP